MEAFNQFIFRIPQFPFSANIKDSWCELKKSIQIASPDFFELIKNIESGEIDALPDRVQMTVLKYFNRAKYRCVPFGTFSSFGTVESELNCTLPLVLADKRTRHKFVDWKCIDQLDYSFDDVLKEDRRVFANSTYYHIDDQIRYVRRINEQFELAEIETDPKVIIILECCRKPISISDLLDQLPDSTSKIEFEGLVEELILCGLIISELDPNIIGKDYFERRSFKMTDHDSKYVMTEHWLNKGTLPISLTRNISPLVKLLCQVLPETQDSIDLEDFMKRFIKRFDRCDVPVMIALDPELGVGYGNLHNKFSSDSVLDQIIGRPVLLKKDSINTDSFLQNHTNFIIGKTIFLEKEFDILEEGKLGKFMPNSSSMIARIVDGNLIVERIGGHSFNQLAGRFTMASQKVLKLCQEITTIEENANPNVIFFDLAYNAESAVDNVNRREHLYKQELNLLNFSELDEPLTLDDLYITISGSEIVLRSKRLGKRMIPRMTSAYNYRRSELPVFRFLYDLSFHGIRGDLSFDPLQLLPGKKYYPRFQFRNIILSPAKLILKISDIKGNFIIEKIQCVRKMITGYKFGNMIRIMNGEEHLVVDCDKEQEMIFLLTGLQKGKDLVIEEFLMAESPLVKDIRGAGFINQFIIPLIHKEEVYYGSGSIVPKDTSKKWAYLPAKDWLSFEIYGSSNRANELLKGPLTEILNRFNNYITHWFFIRYNENGDHLRFRVLVKDSSCRHQMLEGINSLLVPRFEMGLISDVVLRTYFREMERYDVAGIENIERHFEIDSIFVLEMLNSDLSDNVKYAHCIRLFLEIKESGLIKYDRFIGWVDNIRTHFGKEHDMEPHYYKQINSFYKLKGILTLIQKGNESEDFRNLLVSFTNILSNCIESRRAPLFSDLMHMHINRLFADHQRTHEMIIYNFLRNYLNAEKYRSQ